MKKIIWIYLIILFTMLFNISINAQNNTNKEAQLAKTACTFNAIYQLLTNKKLLGEFFLQQKLWISENKESNIIDNEVFIPLNKALLINFLKSSKTNNSNGIDYTKKYYFNKSPKEYQDKKSCNDQISINYDITNCSYTISIKNNFYVKDFGCSEHDLFYTFKIERKKITAFKIGAAG